MNHSQGSERTEAEEDLALVRLVLAGDMAALPGLSERLACVPRILRARNARGRNLLDEHELSDLAQDVFLILWRKLPSYDGTAVLPAWAYRIACFEYENARRKKLRKRREAGEEAEGMELTSRPDPTQPWEFEDVHMGLDRIGQLEAQVIRLKHFGERTFAEIARLLRIPESTAKDRYYRGIAELRPLLNDERSDP